MTGTNTKATKGRLRIGRINFTNTWPVSYYLPYLRDDAGVDWISEVPTGVNRAMAEGRIDIAPISSFAYAERAEDYLILPDLSVSAYGKVNSILLYHKVPLNQLDRARIALPTTSATSVNLLKIILKKFYQFEPHYFYEEPDLDKMLLTADAALLIGDDAIRASWEDHRQLQVTDLGEWWLKLTGKWMTFALWVVRKEAAEQLPELLEHVYHAFCMSKKHNLAHPEAMVKDACEKIGGDAEYWHYYFSNLCYDFGKEQQEGLALYYQYARECGFLDKEVTIRLWDRAKYKAPGEGIQATTNVRVSR
jgi:chorismate dehydratase